jgi:hypothetical protein
MLRVFIGRRHRWDQAFLGSSGVSGPAKVHARRSALLCASGQSLRLSVSPATLSSQAFTHISLQRSATLASVGLPSWNDESRGSQQTVLHPLWVRECQVILSTVYQIGGAHVDCTGIRPAIACHEGLASHPWKPLQSTENAAPPSAQYHSTVSGQTRFHAYRTCSSRPWPITVSTKLLLG